MRERTADLQESYLETIFTMTRAAEHKDEDTGAHVQRISYYSRELAGMLGLDDEFVDRIFFASPMHDIGKIGIPDHILLKPGEPDAGRVGDHEGARRDGRRDPRQQQVALPPGWAPRSLSTTTSAGTAGAIRTASAARRSR